MKINRWGTYAGCAAFLLIAAGPAVAGEPVATTATATAATAAPVSVLALALNDIRAEQRRAVQQSARRALAGLRSETLAALGQGGTDGTSASVQAKP
ncbi:MAG TPA: hypothetical protein VGE51_05215 [Fontimonas sp.]